MKQKKSLKQHKEEVRDFARDVIKAKMNYTDFLFFVEQEWIKAEKEV